MYIFRLRVYILQSRAKGFNSRTIHFYGTASWAVLSECLILERILSLWIGPSAIRHVPIDIHSSSVPNTKVEIQTLNLRIRVIDTQAFPNLSHRASNLLILCSIRRSRCSNWYREVDASRSSRLRLLS